MLYAVEVDMMMTGETPRVENVLKDAAAAYRARGRVLKIRGALARAWADQDRAKQLESLAEQPVSQAVTTKPTSPAGTVIVINDRHTPVNAVLNRQTYRSEPGKVLTVPMPQQQ